MQNLDLFDFQRIPAPLLSWYRANKRALPWRENPTPYRVWVSEIMLQQTRVEAVVGYYERFLTALPDIRALADAPEVQIIHWYQKPRKNERYIEILIPIERPI